MRWHLETLRALVEEYALTMTVTLVKSCQNRADSLTRVPQRWLEVHKKGGEPVQVSCATATSQLNKHQVTHIHQQSGHPGVKRTLYFARIVDPTVSKELIKSVVRTCEACQSIDPAPVHWKKGKIVQSWRRSTGITSHPRTTFHLPRHWLMYCTRTTSG